MCCLNVECDAVAIAIVVSATAATAAVVVVVVVVAGMLLWNVENYQETANI